MDQAIDFHALPQVAAGRARGGRAEQQDAFVCLSDAVTDTRLLVLADGMGGDGAGALASDGVIATARRLWEQGDWRTRPGAIFLETLCQQAHAELVRRRAQVTRGEPHSTVVALLMRGRQACWAHVGDSRLYRFQGRRCLGRTEDHSLAQLKVRQGDITPDQLARDPDQHRLLRGLGGAQPPQVEHGGAMLHAGQTFALCSDGVWEQLSTQELRRLSRQRDQEAAVRAALLLATSRGGEEGDNVALIFVRVAGGWMRRCVDALHAVVGLPATSIPVTRRRVAGSRK